MATNSGLTGEYQHSLDAAGRIALPSRFRDQFQGEVVLARLFEPCVNIYTPEGWDNMRERLTQLDPFKADARTMQRQLLSRVFNAEADRQGRVVIPAQLRTPANLEAGQAVIVLGVEEHLELWSPDLWAQEQARWEPQLSELAERLSG